MDGINYTPPLATDSAEPQKNDSSALGDIIGKLMANPEIMSAIASMAGKAPPKQEPAPEKSNEPKESEESSSPVSADISSKLPEVIEALSPMLSRKEEKERSGDGKPSPRDDRRICLLRAIKPYVSRGRSEAIDYMIQLSRVTELMKHLN